MRFYRVLPYLDSAADDESGGVFFRPPGGKNRADSPTPGLYRCLYVGDTPSGCIAEAFGRFDVWDRDVIESFPATPLVPGSRFALATYEMPDDASTRDLDDAQTLLDEELRPSHVVTRDRTITQQWASRIYATNLFVGTSWWSYYDAMWRSIALWDVTRLRLIDPPRILHMDDDDVQASARTIVRRLIR